MERSKPLTRQIHSDSQKRRLVCVFRFAPFYTNQTPLLPAGDLRRYTSIKLRGLHE